MSRSIALQIVLEDDARRQIDEHLESDTSVQCGGVLAGVVAGARVSVTAAIPARRATSGANSFTFTHEAWDEVNEALRRFYPGQLMVGWYHSHPGTGIFMSEYDEFVQSHYFPEPWQVAYVVDPIRSERSFFVWQDGRLVEQAAAHPSGPPPAPFPSPALPPPPADATRVLAEPPGPAPQDATAAGPAPHGPATTATTATTATAATGRPPRRPRLTARNKAIGAVLMAVVLFVAGYLSHTSSPPAKVTYRTTFAGSALVLDATVTEKGGTATIEEKFSESNPKGTLTGSVSPCVPSGSAIGTYKNLSYLTSNVCNLSFRPGHTSATITATGPPGVILGGVGPSQFSTGGVTFKIKGFSLHL